MKNENKTTTDSVEHSKNISQLYENSFILKTATTLPIIATIITIIATIFGGVYFVEKNYNQKDYIDKTIIELKNEINLIKTKVSKIEKANYCSFLNNTLYSCEKRIYDIDKRLLMINQNINNPDMYTILLLSKSEINKELSVLPKEKGKLLKQIDYISDELNKKCQKWLIEQYE